MQIHSVSEDCFGSIIGTENSSADCFFQPGAFVYVLEGLCSLFKLQLLFWSISLVPCPATSSQCPDMDIFVTAFPDIYQSNVSGDWAINGSIRPVLHSPWWIVEFTYPEDGLTRKGSDLDAPWQLNIHDTDKLCSHTNIKHIRHSDAWAMKSESHLSEE